MLIALLMVGVALLAFGALVLLKYSDRPGGTIKWLGAEVSSKGAGLPLIALGVFFIAFAAVRFPAPSIGPAPNASTSPASIRNSAKGLIRSGSDANCIDVALGEVPRDRVRTVEVGMRDVEIIGSHQKLDAPFALLLTENGQRIGALRVRMYGATNAATALFKIEEAIDAQCANVEDVHNFSRGGSPRELQNWDTLRETLGAHLYDLRIGGEGNINVGFFTRIP